MTFGTEVLGNQIFGSADGGTSIVVASDLDVNWATEIQVTNVLDLRYQVTLGVSRSVNFVYATSNGLIANLVIPWHIYADVENSLEVSWDVYNLNVVTKGNNYCPPRVDRIKPFCL
jgi:hypothetical protein